MKACEVIKMLQLYDFRPGQHIPGYEITL